MGLFESNYKASATTELERELRGLEKRDRVTQNVEGAEMQFEACSSKIDFAEKIRLINQQQAEDFRKRIREMKATENAKHLQRTEYCDDIVDDFENPRERTIRFENMDRVNEAIQREKASESVKTSDTPKEVSKSSHSNDTQERSLT